MAPVPVYLISFDVYTIGKITRGFEPRWYINGIGFKGWLYLVV